MFQLRKEDDLKRLLIAAVAVAILATSCGGESTKDRRPKETSPGAPQATEAPPGVETTVEVSLSDFNVAPKVSEAPAGQLTFAPSVVDGSEGHNFVVVKTDLEPDALPKLPAGNADTTADGVEMLGFLNTFGPGDTPTLNVSATPGKYVLICNIVDHYRRGMSARFTVE
jgi:uncharacterized cupredoxin-like copper-binding protein